LIASTWSKTKPWSSAWRVLNEFGYGQGWNLTMTDMDQRYLEVLRRLGPAGRLKAACGLFEFARKFLTVNLRARHPEWTEEQVRQAVVKRLHGGHGNQ
jgi:hypothetical protein